MNIGYNCLNVNLGYKGGVSTYTLGLLDGLVKTGGGHHFQIYANKENYEYFKKYEAFENFEVVPIKNLGIHPGKLLKIIALATNSPRLFKMISDSLNDYIAKIMDSLSDVIYTPTTLLFPFNNKKITVVSMHDIQQFHYPEFFSRLQLIYRKVHFQISAEFADYLQASSEFIRQDLLEHFKNLRPERIAVIREGVEVGTFSAARDTSYLAGKYGIPDGFLFFPAQLWPHKNHITVLKALLKLKDEKKLDVPLVMTGDVYSAAERILNFIKEHDMKSVHYLGLVPFEDLVALYQKARFLITAVLYESSSLPVLEAAASGLPVIASRTPPNVEMSKILKLNLFEPLDDSALADLIARLWEDRRTIEEQSAYNKSHVAHYSWENVAGSYIEFFEGIV